ncbi:PrsW family intramembrane metalloprotease [Candidatus Peregrinibacteria bacterium]|nr:PrsW family intramembrane metalloprotease [Candidatus Peregrinibacteria bacterium]
MDILRLLQIILVVLLAFLPVVLWFFIWRRSILAGKTKKYVFLVFVLGALSVFPVFLVDYLWTVFPQTDLLTIIGRADIPKEQRIIILFVIVAVLEEIAKLLVVLFVDKTKNLVHSIHEAIKFSIVAALGFAFAENIHYFYNVGLKMELYQFIALFSFRSVITVCGHLVFSGIFGNYYGISKFSKSFSMQEYWGKTKKFDKRTLSDEDLLKRAVPFRIFTIAKGLFFAVLLHASFNYFLEMQMIENVLWLIFAGFLWLLYLFRRSSGYLHLVYVKSKNAHMRDRDKDVVLELLGQWYKDGKYLQVIEVSKRLLKKDPGNPVIRLFLNKSVDNQRFLDLYEALRKLFVRKNYFEGLDEEIEKPEKQNIKN